MASTDALTRPEYDGKSTINLLDLPQEIKDEIWSYVVKKEYHIIPHASPPATSKIPPDDFADLGILRVSKRANHEVLKKLWAWSGFYYDLRRTAWSNAWKRAPTQHMMNIALFIGEWSLGQTNKIPLELIESKVPRKRCFVVYMKWASPDSVPATLIKDLKELTNFVKVEVGFVFQACLFPACDTADEKEFRTVCRIRMNEIGKRLEPALGPAHDGRYRKINEDVGMTMRFYPQEFLSKNISDRELEDRKMEAEEPTKG